MKEAKQLHHERRRDETPTGGEARWEVEELLQELAEVEFGKQVMDTVGAVGRKRST